MTMPEALAVLQKEAKKHQESINQYQLANRTDLVLEEKAELDIIDNYLPEQLPRAEVEKLVTAAITELNAQSLADMGKVIALVRQKAEGQADGSIIAEIAKQNLS